MSLLIIEPLIYIFDNHLIINVSQIDNWAYFVMCWWLQRLNLSLL